MGDIQKAPLSECSMHLTSSGSLFSLPNQNEFSLLGFGHRLLPSNYFALGDCCSVMSDSLRPHGLQHARLLVLHCLLEFAHIHVH